MNKKVLVLTVIIFLFVSGYAFASVYDIYGVDSQGIAMGNARTASADNWTATYYNPAGITQTKKSMGVSFIFIWNHLDIKPFGRGLENKDNTSIHGLSLGLTNNFGTNIFRVGVGLYIPLNDVQKQITHYTNEKEALFTNKLYFELLENRTEHQIILPTIAVKVLPYLSIGGGVSLFIRSITYSHVYLPNIINQSDAFMNVNNVQEYTYVPNLGILFAPSDNFKVGVAYMGQDSFPIKGASLVQVPELGQQFTQPIEQILFFTPAHASIGVMYKPVYNLELEGDLTWVEWSGYINNHNKPPQSQWMDPNTNTLRHGQAWNDIYIPRIGIEYKPASPWRFMLGYFYEPTPVPPQTGRTNYADNVKNVISTGGTYIMPYKNGNINFSIHLQTQILGDRTTYKNIAVDADPNKPGIQNPGYPGYKSKGYIFNTGFEVSYGL